VHQKIVEHHKIESGCKKIAKELKIPCICLSFLCMTSLHNLACFIALSKIKQLTMQYGYKIFTLYKNISKNISGVNIFYSAVVFR